MNRRRFLGSGLVFAALAVVPRRLLAGLDCARYPSQTEGPFFFDPGVVRSDITEGRPGVRLRLALQFVDDVACAPVPGALIQIWHTDREGLYSGYLGQGDGGIVDTRGQTFMRGMQVTDAEGRIEIETIFPGWYPGRVPHIHFKAFLGAQSVSTSQLYFPDDVSEAVYDTDFYRERGRTPVTTANDLLLRNTPLGSVLLDVAGDVSRLSASRSVGIAVPAGFTPAPTATVTPVLPTATPREPTEDCVGDCSGDGMVSIDELVRGVNIALGRSPLAECPAFDRDGNGIVSVAELVRAVNSALRGCA